MMKVFLNGLGASAGAGLTYLHNVVPHLSALRDIRTALALQPHLRDEFRGLSGVTVVETTVPPSTARRFWFEQRELPKLIRQSGADVLISAGNFALRNSPVPQILLSGNSLYTSHEFSRDLGRRNAYGMWLDTRLKGIMARKSVHWSDCTVAPSQAFASELRRWTGKEVFAIHHGFDPEVFFRDQSPLPASVRGKLESAGDCLRLLFVSHYNYYRNFEGLFRSVAILRRSLSGRKFRLFLTCRLHDDENPGSYRTQAAARLIDQLSIRNQVVELGAVPYRLLHNVYRACDIYVTPAYTETFAHPLVEAMASGLPIVASELPVHREICGGAAIFGSSAEGLARCLHDLSCDEAARQRLATNGKRRAADFSWVRHTKALLSIAAQLRERADPFETAGLRPLVSHQAHSRFGTASAV